MDVEWGPEVAWGTGPRLDEFLLARIAEDERLVADRGGDEPPPALPAHTAGEHVSPFDPDRVHAECTARRRLVLACREARPDTGFLGSRAGGPGDVHRPPHDQHQLAMLTLALLALPYAGHRDYREEWRP